jgi:hypothetical protein
MNAEQQVEFDQLRAELSLMLADGRMSIEELKRFLLSYREYLVDCDASPFIPQGWTVESHQRSGQFKLGRKSVTFYLSEQQKKGSVISGHEFLKELSGKAVLNANVLDELLKHPEIIPEEWKDKNVFFWGTIYRRSRGDLCVLHLFWSGSAWRWFFSGLGHDFGPGHPAILAS